MEGQVVITRLDDDEYAIELPKEALQHMKIHTGDEVFWKLLEDGTLILSKWKD